MTTMTKRTYKDKEEHFNQWIEIINYYWHFLKSDLYNNTDFWDNTFHSMDEQAWWDMVDVYDIIRQQYPEEFYRFPYQHEDIAWIKKKLLLGKPVIKPMAKEYNKTGFRAWMVMKDVVNNINGTPTVNYKNNPSKGPDPDPETPFERLFDIL